VRTHERQTDTIDRHTKALLFPLLQDHRVRAAGWELVLPRLWEDVRMMMWIPLTQGKTAIVDEQDYARLSKHKWHALKRGGLWHAVRQKGIYMHRVILDAQKGQEVDHIDGDGLNNTRSNLRFVSRQQNMMNSRKKSALASSKFKGVWWDRNLRKWRAGINLDGDCVHIGLFDSEEDAARAYDRRAREAFGPFAHLNLELMV